jgi:radical SAM protein with 4Fe4S-binding SPASM domain
MNTKNFCPAPWMHLHVINDGKAFPCCMTPLEDNNSFGNVNKQSLTEVLNSPKAKEMRADMLQDKPLPQSCHRCTDKEALGMNTMRTGMVDDYTHLIQDKIADTKEDGTIDKVELFYWDFRFSNYCNLSCRTCSPLFSTSWDKDYKILWKSESKEAALIDLNNATPFWKDLKEQIKYVKSIHFAGGEPILMTEHWRLMDMLVENNLTDMDLHYSTNGTVLTYKGRNVLDLWKKFKHVHLSLSIDGVFDAFNYVRNRGEWSVVEQNLIAIKKASRYHGTKRRHFVIRYGGRLIAAIVGMAIGAIIGNVVSIEVAALGGVLGGVFNYFGYRALCKNTAGIEYWIHPTISILNIYRLPELHDKLLEMGIVGVNNRKKLHEYFITQLHINPLFEPDHYSLTTLPDHHKQAVKKMLVDYADKMYNKYGIPREGWLTLVDFMNSKNTQHKWKHFIDITNKLDTIRKQNFLTINPEFTNDFK